MTAHRIAVIGGGITGLAAAYRLAQARLSGAPIDEVLIESAPRLGGLILSERVGGFLIEAGPDSFLTEKPDAVSLCRELGLGDSLLASNDTQRRTYILHRGRLEPLPEGMVLFVPTRLGPVLRSRLIPFASKLRVVAEWMGAWSGRPPEDSRPLGEGDESVAALVGRHFGKGMLRTAADPMLAGIFGGDSEALSARSTLPRFYGQRNLVRVARWAKGKTGLAAGEKPQQALFTTLKDGVQQLVNALEKRLEPQRICRNRRVVAIETRAGANGYAVRFEAGAFLEAAAVILALPAYSCAHLLNSTDGQLARLLSEIPYSSAATVSLAYSAPVCIPRGFGLLVPCKERHRLLACTFVHQKFAYRTPPGCALLRCFLGGVRDPGALALDDASLIAMVRQELAEILSLTVEPLLGLVYRWPSSMPQYTLGHAKRVAEVERRLEDHPGLFLAGNAYYGVGISDCIRSANGAAEGALRFVTSAASGRSAAHLNQL